MAKNHRNATTSTSAAVATVSSIGAGRIEPPRKMKARERIAFDRIVNERERALWSPQHLLIAANMAVMQVQMEDAQDVLAKEGMTTFGGTGGLKAHPLIQVTATLSGNITQAMRLLGLSASQKGMSVKDKPTGDRATAQRMVAGSVAAAIDASDDLLARPPAN